MSNSVKKLAAHGALFQSLGGVFQVFVRLLSSIVLARMLTPEDFGVYALATLIIGIFSQFSLLGATQAIIIKKNISQVQLSTNFLLNFIIHTLLFFVLQIGSNYFGLFYNIVELSSVLQVISFVFLLKAFSTIPNALLIRNMKFLSITLISVASVVFEVSTAMVLVVYYNYDYWGLVWGLLLGEMITSLFLIGAAKWYPTFEFRKTSFVYFLRYGYFLAAENIAIYLQANIDYFIIGKLLNPISLGIYSFAYRIPNLVYSKLLGPVSGVINPTMSKFKKDKDLIDGYLKFTKYIGFIGFPLLISLFLISEYLVPFLWGFQWIEAIEPMKILIIVTGVSIIGLPMGSILLVKNRPDLLFYSSLLKLPITFLLVLIFGYFYKLIGIAYGMAFSALIAYYISFIFIKRVVKITYRMLYEYLSPLIIITVLVLVLNIVIHYFTKIIGNLNIILLPLSVIGSYWLILLLIYKKELYEIKKIFLLFKKTKEL